MRYSREVSSIPLKEGCPGHLFKVSAILSDYICSLDIPHACHSHSTERRQSANLCNLRVKVGFQYVGLRGVTILK